MKIIKCTFAIAVPDHVDDEELTQAVTEVMSVEEFELLSSTMEVKAQDPVLIHYDIKDPLRDGEASHKDVEESFWNWCARAKQLLAEALT